MAKDRERVCQYYTYAGGPCDKRGISVYMDKECQKCKKYFPLAGAQPRRTDNRRKKMDRILKKERRDIC